MPGQCAGPTRPSAVPRISSLAYSRKGGFAKLKPLLMQIVPQVDGPLPRLMAHRVAPSTSYRSFSSRVGAPQASVSQTKVTTSADAPGAEASAEQDTARKPPAHPLNGVAREEEVSPTARALAEETRIGPEEDSERTVPLSGSEVDDKLENRFPHLPPPYRTLTSRAVRMHVCAIHSPERRQSAYMQWPQFVIPQVDAREQPPPRSSVNMYHPEVEEKQREEERSSDTVNAHQQPGRQVSQPTMPRCPSHLHADHPPQPKEPGPGGTEGPGGQTAQQALTLGSFGSGHRGTTATCGMMHRLKLRGWVMKDGAVPWVVRWAFRQQISAAWKAARDGAWLPYQGIVRGDAIDRSACAAGKSLSGRPTSPSFGGHWACEPGVRGAACKG